jgi:tetratricopeptide (TPR) repeat protein
VTGYYQLGQYEKAMADVDRADDDRADTGALLKFRGDIAMRMTRYEQAINYYNSFLDYRGFYTHNDEYPGVRQQIELATRMMQQPASPQSPPSRPPPPNRSDPVGACKLFPTLCW